MKATKYFVYLDGDDRYDWFDEEVEAIVYAQKNGNKNTKIYKVEGELSDDGFDFDYEEANKTPVEFSMELPEEEPVEVVDDDFDVDFPDIPEVESSDDIDYDAMAKQYADDQLVDPYESDEFDGHEDFDVKEALDKLEENESEVECKNCFDLFPKEECIKTEHGYLCKKCNQELHSHQGTNLDLIDANPKDIDYDDPRLPEEKEEPEVKEEPVDANEIRKHEAGIKEELKRKLNNEHDVFDYYYNNWLDCEVDYDELYSVFELGLKGKKFPANKLVKAYGWGSDYDYLESMYDTGKDIHDRGLQAVVDAMAQDYALDNADDMNDQKEVQTLEEDAFETLDELNAETRKAYHYSCDPSGVEGSVDATSEKEAQRKVEDILAGKGIYVPDEIITIDEGLSEDLKVITDFNAYEPWSGAVDTYELIKDAGKLDDLEAYLEECYPDGLTVTQINDILWFDDKQILQDLGIEDSDDTEDYEDDVEELPATQDESLEEHINDRPADIESDQENHGVDNAVVDCKKYTVVAHSEDEKPVDCKLEKPALEEPVAGKKVDGKFYENLEEAKKDEDELPPDPEVVKLEVHQELNNLVADEIEAIDGYEEVKADIIDKPIEHKDEIIDTINHIEGEEKEHIDELVSVTTEIPFDKESDEVKLEQEERLADEANKEIRAEIAADEAKEPAPVIEEPVVEEGLEESAADTPVKVGDSILIVGMEGEPDYCGRKGKVEHIDDIGQLHGTWGSLAVIPGVDKFDIITDECLKEDVNKVGYITMVIGDGGDDIYYVGYDKDAAIKAVDDQYPDWINFGLGGGDTAPGVIECNLSDDKNQAAFDTLLKRYNNKEKLYDGDLKAFGYNSYRELLNNFYDNLKVIYSGDEEAPEDEWPTWEDEDPFAITDSDIEYLNTEAPGLDDENDGRALHELNLKDALTAAQHWYEVNDGDVFWYKVAKALEAKLKQANENDLIDSFALSNDKIIVNTKQANESLKEEKAKPAGNKETDYKAALKLAAAHNKPVIYGYSNKSYNGKYFTLDDPIVCDNVFDETKKFKQKYKSCGTAYVAYPDDYEGLKESYRFSPEEQEEYNCDEDGCYEDNGHWGRLVKCNWCGEFYDDSECKFEADFGWLCDRCQDELHNHGGPLTFIEPGPQSCDEEDELEAKLQKKD